MTIFSGNLPDNYFESIPSTSTPIFSGKLKTTLGDEKDYRITRGHDLKSAAQCTVLWADYNIKLVSKLHESTTCETKIASMQAEITGEHGHWNWVNKHVQCSGTEYEWFYVIIDNEPHAAGLVYHPKDSVINGSNIFYIEFIAVAPWNRPVPFSENMFSGVGTPLINKIVEFATVNLMLTPRFSLHSLPQSTGYYEKIGMQHYAAYDKGSLKFYELPNDYISLKAACQ